MKVELFRMERKSGCTLGMLRVDGEIFCATLENSWLDNTPCESCIPVGCYMAERVSSPHFGNTFEVVDVPGRTHILFHAGNTEEDTLGCILPGKYHGRLGVKRAVLDSRNTFNDFIKLTEGVMEFDLFIVDV